MTRELGRWGVKQQLGESREERENGWDVHDGCRKALSKQLSVYAGRRKQMMYEEIHTST
jgi:hypothetical protein